MIQVTFRVADEQQYARRFDALAEETRHLREPLSRISQRLRETVGEQFQTQGAHGLGASWTPLNDDYRRWKEAHYPGRPMLVRTAAMRQAFLVEGERELTDRTLRWGVDTQTDEDGMPIRDRADAHQTGEGHVPQRKIIALRNDDRRAFDHEFVAWFNGQRHRILGAGGRL